MRPFRSKAATACRARLFSTGTSRVSTAPSTSTLRPRLTLPWTRPIQAGVNPAYDFALEFIEKDTARLRKELEVVRGQLAEASTEEDVERLQARLRKLEVDSEINLPEVRWNFKNERVDLSKPVYRHLAEKAWRKDGPLDLILQRIWQMHVIPDILPAMDPTMDLRILFGTGAALKKVAPVEPGVFLATEQTIAEPRLQATVFHPDTRYYTLVMVDGDVPEPSNQSYTTFLHWLKPNIPLSSETSFQDIDTSNPLLSYIPPHPQSGTPYHRYVTMLLPQDGLIELPTSPIERRGFSMRDFMRKWNVTSESGGIHLWRAKHDEGVSKIYQEILQQPEPKYAAPPKPDRYEGRRDKKYI